MKKLLFLLLAGSLLSTVSVWATEGDWDRARTAHERGDYTTEIAIVRPLAEQGFAFAQFNLGVLYDNGYGVPLDDLQAMEWYRKAAQQGLPQAQINLGIMYEEGEGGPADFVQAYFWYAMADSQGDSQAPQAKQEVIEKMTPSQIEEAKRKVEEWQATHVFSIPPSPAPETQHGDR
ncbi:MAG: sel1 repeat family protein [Gammaproteobacteria bacterium]|nr:sel1 repeat family protein [Gammaproteobacteria bacterium]MCP5198312.1 sel1 repeat family protein [Gammaproteobacteria bacterium]